MTVRYFTSYLPLDDFARYEDVVRDQPPAMPWGTIWEDVARFEARSYQSVIGKAQVHGNARLQRGGT